MGSRSDSPIMGCLVLLSLVAILSCGIQGASLPYQNGLEWHFNQMGVNLDLALKDQVNPLIGGKAHVELPISTVWKLLEVDQSLLKSLIVALEDQPILKPLIVAFEDQQLLKPLIVALEDQQLLNSLIVALEKSTLGRIYDVMTVKADITFNAEKVLEGICNVAVDYT